MEPTSLPSLVRRLLEPDVLVFCVPIVLIVVGGLVKIVRMIVAHRERITMIEMGIHPDYMPEDAPHTGLPDS